MALTTKRLNWLEWLYPGPDGLLSEQGWHIDKRRNHMMGEHIPGIVTGLEVLASGSPDLFVHVQPGRAIDGIGEEVVLAGIVDVDLTSYAVTGATVKIVAEFTETGTDAYVVPETSTSQDKFLQDTPTISAIDGAPAANQIELAQVIVSNGAIAIDDAADPSDPQDDEIDFRSHNISNPPDVRLLRNPKANSNFRTVTVGEEGCDFTSIDDAFAYFALRPSNSNNPWTIILFAKQYNTTWTITATHIPDYVRIVGVGRPNFSKYGALTTGDYVHISDMSLANGQWTLGKDCMLRNVYMSITMVTTDPLVRVDTGCVIENFVGSRTTPGPLIGGVAGAIGVRLHNIKDDSTNKGIAIIEGGFTSEPGSMTDWVIDGVTRNTDFWADVDEFEAAGPYIYVNNGVDDWVSYFVDGRQFIVSGATNLSNNGLYTVNGTALNMGARTRVPVAQAVTNETSSPAVVKPPDYVYEIAAFAASPNLITLENSEGDVGDRFLTGRTIEVAGDSNVANNRRFTVVSATSATPTVITVVEEPTPNVGTDAVVQHPDIDPGPDGLGWDYDKFFEWTEGYVKAVVYQAPCDLVVHAYATSAGAIGESLTGITDISPSPKAIRIRAVDHDEIGTNVDLNAITFSVRKGDYWEVSYPYNVTISVLAKGR